MTIRQKIRLSNILMVLIPTAVTAVFIFICLNTSLGSYWHTLETMYQDENGIQSAQSLIYTYQQELWENNWEECSLQTEPLVRNEMMNHLERKLSKMGYYIQIRKNGNEIYSNISEEDMTAAKTVAGDALDSAKVLTASRHEVSVIKLTFYKGEKALSIIAVNNGHTDTGMESYLQSYILKYIRLFALLFFVLVIGINAVLSWWISRSVLNPLKLLSDGTRQIREGNLEDGIAYHKKDEFGAVCRDFDAMRDYLRQSVSQRLEYENRRRDLILGISHDLRTPLTSIRGYLDGVIDGIANTPEKRERYLNAIRTRTLDMERLVDSLSEYSRLENHNFQYHMERIDFRMFLEDYLSAYRDEALSNRVEIRFSSRLGRYPVELDTGEMGRVFGNLFTNTIRYREKDRSCVQISLDITAEGTMVETVYADDGPGVPEDCLERIFESFYRGDSARSHSENGSGLGLAVVREIIKGHGGAIYAENRQGLALIITLPLAKEDSGE